MMLPLTSFIIFLAAAGFAGVVGTMAGFGAATILTPVASYFMNIKTAIAIVAAKLPKGIDPEREWVDREE